MKKSCVAHALWDKAAMEKHFSPKSGTKPAPKAS